MYGEISFPGLGISINPSRVAFSIGSKPIYWYGIVIALGFILAVYYGLKRSKQFGLTEDNVIDMLIFAVPLAIICARAYYCIFSWDLYKDNPISVLYIWEGGLAIYGGVIGAVIGVVLCCMIRKMPMRPLLDIGGLGLLIGQSIGRWGNFFNREAFGATCNNFLRMGLADANGMITYHHPTFLYESLWNAIGFLLLHFYSKHRKYDGQVFIMYIGWYGLGRVFIEGLRTDSLYVGTTNLRISQLLAGCCVLAAVVLLFYNKMFKEHDPEELYVNQNTAQAADASTVVASAASDTTVSPDSDYDAEISDETTADADDSAENNPEENEIDN